MYSCEIWADADLGQMPILSVQVPIHASEILSDIHAKYWEPYYYVTNILISCGRCISVKFGKMPIHSLQVPIRASEICRTSTLCIGNHTTMLPIINLLWPMYSCEIWENADPFCAGADPCIRNFVGHPRYVLGTILLCYQYINLLRSMYSCEIWADADPFCER